MGQVLITGDCGSRSSENNPTEPWLGAHTVAMRKRVTHDSRTDGSACWVAPIRNQPDGTQTDSNCDTTERDAAQPFTERVGRLPQLTL